jgi:hypothetical protein
MFEVFLLLLVGVLWGVTNYLIQIYYCDYESFQNNENLLKKFLLFLKYNYKPIFFSLINQSASVLFYFCLGKISLSLTVIISNSTSFLTSLICEIFHLKKCFRLEYYLGLACVIFGISICIYNN